MHSFIRLYEEFSDSSAFEHINPNVVFRVFIASEDPEGQPVVTVVPITGEDFAIDIPFPDYKAAHRFIKRLGGIV